MRLGGGLLAPMTENRAADPDMGRTQLNRRLEIATHPHGECFQPVALGDFS